MSSLRNPKHEIVAQELAAGKTPEQASDLAGYDRSASSFASNARKRAQRKDIRERLKEIQAIGAKCAAVTAESLIFEAEEARRKAMTEKGGAGAAISAVTCKAKLAGLWVEKGAFTDPTGKTAAPVSVRVSFVQPRAPVDA